MSKIMDRSPISIAENMDCMDMMREKPDGFWDLVIADPPYGINESKRVSYHPNALTKYRPGKWDKTPPGEKFFEELFRVTKNQIIWGGNYFDLPPCAKPLIWDKMQPEGIDQAMFEYAWQSNSKIQAKIYRQSATSNSNNVSNNKQLARVSMRIHPTQKPVALYKWLLQNYAKPGDKILDPMMGSGSSRIAAWDMGFEYWGCELDSDYFAGQEKRFAAHTAKPLLFQPGEMYNFEQTKLFTE